MIRWVNAQLSILPRRGANWTGNRDNGVKLGLTEANWDIWSKFSSLCYSHTDFLNVPWTCHTHLRVFALAISSAWNALPPRNPQDLLPHFLQVLTQWPFSLKPSLATLLKLQKDFSLFCVCVFIYTHMHTHAHAYTQYLCVFIFYETGKNKPNKALIHHLVHGLCANICK